MKTKTKTPKPRKPSPQEQIDELKREIEKLKKQVNQPSPFDDWKKYPEKPLTPPSPDYPWGKDPWDNPDPWKDNWGPKPRRLFPWVRDPYC